MTDSNATSLTFAHLKNLVAGNAVAIRGEATLEPAGGAGDKVFPPSHSIDKNERAMGAKYAFEDRHINGKTVKCVLLDSVQSQANRMEEALQALWNEKRISLPVLVVDLSDVAPDIGKVTSLTAPHRIADALLRDSMLDGTLFRLSPIGRSFTDATTRNATQLFKVCPTGLVFGLWDSTGPKGGLGSKFARALVSEIVGIDATPGVKTASRIDPTQIVTNAGPVFVAKEPGPDGRPTWTHDVKEARPLKESPPKKEGKPSKGDPEAAFEKWGDSSKAGKPTAINHSNIPPTIDKIAGGVTIAHARHTVVLSLAALRRLSFPGGDVEARTVLAALGLLAVLAAEDRGHDLRSRCLLVPGRGKALALEVVQRDGETQKLRLDLQGAIDLYNAAIAALPDSLRFSCGPGVPLATLVPSKKLAHLITRSRELAAAGADVEEE